MLHYRPKFFANCRSKLFKINVRSHSSSDWKSTTSQDRCRKQNATLWSPCSYIKVRAVGFRFRSIFHARLKTEVTPQISCKYCSPIIAPNKHVKISCVVRAIIMYRSRMFSFSLQSEVLNYETVFYVYLEVNLPLLLYNFSLILARKFWGEIFDSSAAGKSMTYTFSAEVRWYSSELATKGRCCIVSFVSFLKRLHATEDSE